MLGLCLGICVIEFEGEDFLEIEGFYCYNLCECDFFVIEWILWVIEVCFGKWLFELKWLNLGGGYLMISEDYDVVYFINIFKDFK